MERQYGRKESPKDERDYLLSNFIKKEESARTEMNWRFFGRPLDQGDTGHCFPSGTLIRMADGSSKKIEEIKLLDEVFSAERNKCKVLKVMVREYFDKLIKIELWGHRSLKCTPDHNILTKRGYIAAKDLCDDDFVAIPRISLQDDFLSFQDVVSPEEYRKHSHIGKSSYIGGVETIIVAPFEKIKKDYKLGRLFGLYFAEGYSDTCNVRFSYNDSEENTLVKETCDLLTELFGATPRIQHRKHNHVMIVVLGGKHWSLLFKRLMGEGAKNKRLHPLLCGNDDFRRGILDGWIDGDGHERRTSVSGTTVSFQLAHDMFCIANDLGLLPTLSLRTPIKNKYAKNRLPSWNVEWGTASSIDNNVSRTWRSDLSEAYTWRKIDKIKEEDFSEKYVYNLEIERDHSYIANGIGVHNCCGFSMANFGINEPINTRYSNEDGHKFYYLCKVKDGEPNAETGSDIRTVAKVLVELGIIKNYAFAKNIEEVKYWLLNKGCMIVGTDWYEGMDTPDENNIVHLTGKRMGGHAYLLNEWRKDGYIGIQNSWDGFWGIKGKAYISAKDFEKLLLKWGGEALAAVEIEHETSVPKADPNAKFNLINFLIALWGKILGKK